MQRGDSLELNFEDLEMQKMNYITDRPHRVDQKNGSICLIMFTLRFMVIKLKMSKMAHFVFSADES